MAAKRAYRDALQGGRSELWLFHRRDEQRRSAPEKPLLGRKFLITTVIATVLWAIAYTVIESGMLSFRGP